MRSRMFPADPPEEQLTRYSDLEPGDLVVNVTNNPWTFFSIMSVHPDDAAYVESEMGVPVIEKTGTFTRQTVGLVLAVRGRYCYVTSNTGTGWVWSENITQA